MTEGTGALRAVLHEAVTGSGKTQRWIADALGVEQGTVSRWVRGITRPGEDELELLAAALERPIVVSYGTPQAAKAGPDWDRLVRTVDAIAVKLKVSVEDAVERSVTAAVDGETSLQPGGDGAPTDPKRPAPARE